MLIFPDPQKTAIFLQAPLLLMVLMRVPVKSVPLLPLVTVNNGTSNSILQFTTQNPTLTNDTMFDEADDSYVGERANHLGKTVETNNS